MVKHTGEVVIPDPEILPPPAKKDTDKIGEVVVVTYRQLDANDEEPSEEAIEAFKQESIRVIELIPDLVPGKQRGKNVNVLFNFPIVFKMQ